MNDITNPTKTLERSFKNYYFLILLLRFKLFRVVMSSTSQELARMVALYENSISANENLQDKFDPKAFYNLCVETIEDFNQWFESILLEFRTVATLVGNFEDLQVHINAATNSFYVANTKIAKQTMDKLGPPIWKDLHGYAKNWDGDTNAQTNFLDVIKTRIPCGECKSFWVAELKDNPAPNDSAASFFKWTVEVHNKVNVKLQKPELTFEEAISLY